MLVQPLCIIEDTASQQHILQQDLPYLPMLSMNIACGFPSPADDYLETMPCLDELLIKHPNATILARASGDSMIERGILDGSLVIIDRAITAKHNDSIVASIGGELTIKIIDLEKQQLIAANPQHPPITIPKDFDTYCEGVVTYSITAQPC